MEENLKCKGSHTYSRALDQPQPRKCINCPHKEGEEGYNWMGGNGIDPAMKQFDSSLLIIGVAVRFYDVVIALKKPNRHHHCFSFAREQGITNPTNRADDQGFYLEDGTYLTRKEAFHHATKTKQIINPEAKNYLFSEDLW